LVVLLIYLPKATTAVVEGLLLISFNTKVVGAAGTTVAIFNNLAVELVAGIKVAAELLVTDEPTLFTAFTPKYIDPGNAEVPVVNLTKISAALLSRFSTRVELVMLVTLATHAGNSHVKEFASVVEGTVADNLYVPPWPMNLLITVIAVRLLPLFNAKAVGAAGTTVDSFNNLAVELVAGITVAAELLVTDEPTLFNAFTPK
jgi:hypothetical protein